VVQGHGRLAVDGDLHLLRAHTTILAKPRERVVKY
jgi:hypothetical protein